MPRKTLPVRIDEDIVRKVKSKGVYGETFSDILRRLLKEARKVEGPEQPIKYGGKI